VLLALGCGNVDGDSSTDTPNIEPPADPCTNPLLAECQPEERGAGGSSSGGGEGSGGEVEETPAEEALRRAEAENILRVNCGQCHGPALSPEAIRAGMNYIDDIDRLVETGKIIPLQSASSRVIQYMRDGVMPPAGVQPRPSEREIDVVADFIDNPDFWPEYSPLAPCDNELETFDDIYRSVADDLRDADAEDQPFLRYLTLTNRYNAGLCETQLDQDRHALAKLVNMLSLRSSIEAPQAIDGDQGTIYRIDIRDYAWDREVTVAGVVFRDGWEAIIDESDYAIPFVGEDADDVRADSGTDVAVLSMDGLVESAGFSDLYYALIGVDVNQPLATFISDELGINVALNLADGDLVRAGTTQSDLTRQDRVIERHNIEDRPGAYWQSFDFEADVVNSSIFVDPFDFAVGGTEAIFTLPNGMLGFIIADANDAIVDESNILLDTFADDYVARTAVSCSGCHARGFNEAVDEVRDFAEANLLEFNRDEIELIREIYLPAEDFAAVIEDDSELFQRSLDDAGVPVTSVDPVSQVFLRFERDLDLVRAAGDLGTTPEALRRDIADLNPVLEVVVPLAGVRAGNAPKLDRDDFTAIYLESLCVLLVASDNQPDPVLCAEVVE
jgi:mono/diheme cytochrome c family protein